MGIFSVANEKGGVLKSTISFHLAYRVVQHWYKSVCKKVAMIDLDTQGSSSSLMVDREDTIVSIDAIELLTEKKKSIPIDWGNDKFVVVCPGTRQLVEAENLDPLLVIDTLKHNLALLGADTVIIDTPPSLGTKIIAAIAVSAGVIIPHSFTDFSHNGVEKVIADIKYCRQHPSIRSKVVPLGVVGTLIDTHDKVQRENFIRELKEAANPDLFVESPLRIRPVTRRAVDSGKLVWEVSEGSPKPAIDEMVKVLDILINRMGITKGDVSDEQREKAKG